MTTRKKSEARSFLEKIVGPLTLGSLIAAIRKGDELSQAVFSKKLKISISHLSDIENERKAVSPQRARDFAKRLGYSDKQFIRLALQDTLKRQGIPYTIEQLAA